MCAPPDGGPKFLLRARIGPRAPEHFLALAAPILLVKNRLITRNECIDDEQMLI